MWHFAQNYAIIRASRDLVTGLEYERAAGMWSRTSRSLARSQEVEPMTVDRLLALGRDAALIVLSIAYVVVHF